LIFIKMKVVYYITLVFVANLIFACSNNEVKQEDNNPVQKETSKKTISPPKDIKIIDIQPYEGLSEDIVNYVYSELKKVCPKVNLLKVKPLPKRAYYKPRNRYRADTIIALQRDYTLEGHVTMGLTNKDISTDNGAIYDYGIMGLAFNNGKAGVASTFRLKKTKIKEQYFKVVIHELGHTQGLDHCPDIACLMTDANGKNNTDKEIGFCKKCKAHLVNKGWKLN
jgi:archaemetzincin